MNVIVIILLLFLLIVQFRFISLNTTTSEELRKEKTQIANFNQGSCSKNMSTFYNDIFSYKREISYGEDLLKLLKKNETLVERKMKIYSNNSYNPSNTIIEFINKPSEDTTEEA